MARNVTGDKELIAKLGGVRAALRSTQLEGQVATEILRRVRARFNRQVNPEGEKWKSRTQNGKKRNNKPLLQRTGTLKNSISILLRNNSSAYTNTGMGFRIGVKPKLRPGKEPMRAYIYGRWHNYGEAGMVQRQFLGISAGDRQYVVTMISRGMLKGWNQS